MSQFTDDQGRATLADYIKISGIYPAGRLDYDSEGLMALTGDGKLQSAISHPRAKRPKTYWVQVDGDIDDNAIDRLRAGVELKDGPTQAAVAHRIDEPAELWPRDPPVRYRANIPTSWLALTISEGRNRQVRRMTAAVGFPTLRLIRAAIGDWQLDDLQPGQYRQVQLSDEQRRQLIPPSGPASRTGQKRRGQKPRGAAPSRSRRSITGRRGRVGK